MNINPLAMTLLRLLARNPGREFFLRELSRATGTSVGGCHKALSELAGLGLVAKRKSGKNAYFSADDSDPTVRQFKVFATLLELRPLAYALSDVAVKVVLFGSCVNGTDTADSDVDLLIVSETPEDARKVVGTHKTSRRVEAIVAKPSQLLRMREENPSFHAQVDKGIILVGGTYGRVREVRE